MDADGISVIIERFDIVQCLAGGENDKRGIASATDQSRSTVYRGLQELIDAGFVEDGGRKELTPLGRSVNRSVGHLVDECELFKRREQLVSSLAELTSNPDETVLDPSVVRSFDVTRSQPHAPNRAVSEFTDLLTDKTMESGSFPVMYPEWASVITEELGKPTSSVGLLLKPSIVENYRETLVDIEEDETVKSEKIPDSVGVCRFGPSESVSVLVCGPQGVAMHANSTDPDAIREITTPTGSDL